MEVFSFKINDIIAIAKRAGRLILEYYQEPQGEIMKKADNSPVTQADIAANDYIVTELEKLYPEIPVISEENRQAHNQAAQKAMHCFMVDPLDGTKSFIKRTDEFTVNIAYIKQGVTQWGVIVVPAKQLTYHGGLGETPFAYKQEGMGSFSLIQCRNIPKAGPTIVASKSHLSPETQAYVDHVQPAAFRSAASSLKLCALAEGTADIYPRLSPTSEWDIAAGHAILKGAGGNVFRLDQTELTYMKEDILNPSFIALGDLSRMDLVRSI